MEENIIQINSGITINIDVTVKNVMYMRKIILGTLLLAVVKMENIWQVLWIIQQLREIKLKTWKKQKLFQKI